jgi:hypothetical protein
MTPEILALWVALIKMGVKLGVDIYEIIKDSSLNVADVDELCKIVDEARESLRPPDEEE